MWENIIAHYVVVLIGFLLEYIDNIPLVCSTQGT